VTASKIIAPMANIAHKAHVSPTKDFKFMTYSSGTKSNFATRGTYLSKRFERPLLGKALT
jgi:hypothetical protein